MNMKLVRMMVVAALVLGLSGCGDEQPAGTAPVQQQAAKKASEAVQKQAVKEEGADKPAVVEYVYLPEGKRNPFRSPLEGLGDTMLDDSAPLTPLQKYDLTQFSLQGVVVGLKTPSAMVGAPDGKTYIVRPGTRMGRNNGTVVEITKEGIFVEETYRDFTGEVRKGIQTILLPRREGVQ